MNAKEKERLSAMPFTATLTARAMNGKECDTWRVSLDGYVTTYSKGIGLREGFKLPFGRISRHDEEQFLNPKMSRTVGPTREEVAQALAMDACTFLDCIDLDDFAKEVCEGLSVSKTVEVYEACRNTAAFFQRRGLDPYNISAEDDEDTDNA